MTEVAAPTLPAATSVLTAIPWLVPGVLASLVASLLLAPILRRLLGASIAVALLLVVSTGIIISATLTPLGGIGWEAEAGRSCDLDRIALAPIPMLLSVNDTSLNILLFVPLGVSIGLVPRSRRALAALIPAVAFPFGIEVTQLLVPVLGRGCESADVVDNLTGLVIGLSGPFLLHGIRASVVPPPGA
jgi:glycopeptide antibiotics resistance protein